MSLMSLMSLLSFMRLMRLMRLMSLMRLMRLMRLMDCSEYTKSFDQDVILSNSVIPKVAWNGFLVEGFGVYNSIGMP